VQEHIHAGKTSGHHVLFLSFKRDVLTSFCRNLEQERTGATGRVIGRGRLRDLAGIDAYDLGKHAAHFRRRIELTFALAAFRSEVAHQVFVGVTEKVVVVGPVLREIEILVLENGDEMREAVHHLSPFAELCRIVEIREVGSRQSAVVSFHDGLDDLLVDLVADVGTPLELAHIAEAGTGRNLEGGKRPSVGEFIGYVLDKKHEEHVVLVLAGIHAAAKNVAALPKL